MAHPSAPRLDSDIDDAGEYIIPVLCREPAYPYRRLIDNDIRLLSILPGRGILECTLHQMPVVKDLCFYALSYVWGDGSETREILLEGKPFKVTRNLYEALYQFRERPGAPATIGYPNDYFWVDAICLNQEDLDEKAYQVPRMMKIYQAALAAIIWLGPNKPATKSERLGKKTVPSSTNPVELLRRGRLIADSAVKLLFKKAETLWIDWELPDDVAEEESVLRGVFGEEYDAVLQAAAELLQKPWFGRIWTFQECSLNINARVFAGRHDVDLQNLINMLKALARHHRLLGVAPGFLRIRALTLMKNKWHAKTSSDLRGEKVEASVAECLSEVLSSIFGAEATNPRDRLYGLIGLVNYFSGNLLPDELKPNYHLPFEVVYWQYAAYLFQHNGDLRLLSTLRQKLEGVPSWVPDFRDLSLRGQMNRRSTVRLSEDRRRLYLRGIRMEPICDTVGEWWDPRQYTNGIQPDLHYRLRYVEGRIFKLASQIRNVPLEGVLDDFLWKASRLFNRGGVDGARRAYTDLKGFSSPNGFWVPTRKRVKTTDAFGKEFAIADEMRHCLILLDDGTVLSAPRAQIEIKSNDVVCIFKGAAHPTIIRPSEEGDSFVLVSHCESRSGTFYRQVFDEAFWEARKLEEFEMI